LAPFIAGLEVEGSYGTKPPCYFRPTFNEYSPVCLHGTPFNSARTQNIMGGDLPEGVTLINDDNFHNVADTDPIHLPNVQSSCADRAAGEKCTINIQTVSQNIYTVDETLPFMFMQYTSASETKTKILARQNIQRAAGVIADFHETDEVGNRCGDINTASIEWAYKTLSAEQRKEYDARGIQMVTGDDMGPYNAGPLWIWTLMNYTLADTLVVRAPMMRTPTNYKIQSAAGFHYCKVLSPFRALEWMTIDSLRPVPHSPAALFLQ